MRALSAFPLHRAVIDKPDIDLQALRAYRLERIRGALRQRGIAFCMLVNPVSLRYAVDFREYQGFQSHMPSMYLFVPVEGPVVLFGASGDYALVGDWFEGRMLCSGPRTNPWLQEASERVIEAGDFVAFDTDMIGPFGYAADISRTWLCGPAAPTAEQRSLYRSAHEEVHHNIDLIRPGMTFFEFMEKAYRQPRHLVARRYPTPCHGIGMSDEYPKLHYRQDRDRGAYDGVIEENMTLCLESYCGSENGGPGVKLEQMVLVGANGCEALSSYPFEDVLLA